LEGQQIMSKPFQISLAPERLFQPINPLTFFQQGASFGIINVNFGQTPRPEVEQEILEEVGSYGRQLGRIGDALEILLKNFEPRDQEERDAIDAFRGQLAGIRQIKRRMESRRDSRATTFQT
jgi:hypothetical protein